MPSFTGDLKIRLTTSSSAIGLLDIVGQLKLCRFYILHGLGDDLIYYLLKVRGIRIE
jgi:hypothetical protein